MTSTWASWTVHRSESVDIFEEDGRKGHGGVGLCSGDDSAAFCIVEGAIVAWDERL